MEAAKRMMSFCAVVGILRNASDSIPRTSAKSGPREPVSIRAIIIGIEIRLSVSAICFYEFRLKTKPQIAAKPKAIPATTGLCSLPNPSNRG